MTRATRAAVAAFPLLLVVLLCGFSAGTAGVSDATILVTAAPAYDPLAALHGAERFPQGAQLLMVRGGKAEPLVADFAASADASVSFDAKTVLFAGKKSGSDPWRIWELTLADRSVRQVTAGTEDAIRPLYLPERRMVFARREPQGLQLVTAGLDGKDEAALTYMRGNAVAEDVLADGRILFQSGYPLGSGAVPELFLVYSDGSGVESYRCDHGTARPGSAATGDGRWGGHQLASGDVVFTHGTSLARFTSPLAHEEKIAAPRGEYAGGAVEILPSEWIVSSRISAAAPFALREWRPSPGSAPAAMKILLARSGQNLVEPVLVAPRERPRHHPSALHDWTYGNLLSLDARLSRDGALTTTPVQVRLETMDASGKAVAMGTSTVEGDGSFFVKVPADQPIRFVLLDDKGTAVRQEHGWFWIRRGEQRVCVGCHTGPERAAENNVPAVLLRSTVPTDLSGMPAQSVEQSAEKGRR